MTHGAPAGSRRVLPAVSIALAVAAAGAAVWLLPASAHIVEWPRSGPQRIAVFAPLDRLIAIGAVVAVAAAGLLVAGRHHLARIAWLLAPLHILWVWTVPYWPWVPDRLPLLVALAGPVRWGFAALAVGGMAARLCPAWPRIGWRPGRGTVFAVSLALYSGFGLYTLAANGLGGDEPHYLVITQSLLLDGDLKIENNHARRDYRSYFAGELRPDYMTRGVDREIYSIHAPGLSALLIPGFAIAGTRGAVVTMCVLAALAALAIFDIACLVGGSGVAWATWAAVCLTVPTIPHAWSLFPEMAGTAIVAWGVLWGMQAGERSSAVWLWRGLCLAWLPWLHTKFSVLMAGLAIHLAWRLRSQWIRAGAFLAPMAVSGVAWLASFYVIYGTISPEAPYGEYAARFVRFENVPRSVLGLLFDQKFGLLVYAPAFAIALPGFWFLLRDRAWRTTGMATLAIAAVFGLSSARLYMWWGGSSAPARFLVPITPLLAPAVAAGVHRLHGVWQRASWSAAVLIGVAVASAGAIGAREYLLYSEPHGVSRILNLLQGSVPLTGMLPTFTQPEWIAPARQAMPWMAAGLVALAAGWLTARRTTSPLWVVVSQVCTFTLVVAMAFASVPADLRADTRMRGDMALLDRFDPEHLRTFDYARLARLSPEEWLQSIAVGIDRVPGTDPDGIGRLTAALRLPAGVYEATVWFEGARQLPGALQATVGHDNLVARLDGPLSNPAVLPLILPVAVPSLWLQLTDLTSARLVRRIELAPKSVQPASDRPRVLPAAVEAVPGWMTAYVAHLASTYPENGVFWTRGSEWGRLLLVPAGATTAVLTLHVGPGPNTVRVRVGDQDRELAMESNETAMLRVPLPPGQAIVPLEVQAGQWFRPSDVEPTSADRRQLGCQVRLVLE